MFVTLSLILLLFFPSVYVSRDTEGELLGFSQLPALGSLGRNPPRDVVNDYPSQQYEETGLSGSQGLHSCALTNNNMQKYCLLFFC